jgi:hypothetical protein
MRSFAIALMILSAGSAGAAPFCIDLPGAAPQCIHVDPNSCRIDANRMGGRCVLNPLETRAPRATMPICLVQAQNVVLCTYADKSSCDADSQRQGGFCIDAPTNVIPAKAGIQ